MKFKGLKNLIGGDSGDPRLKKPGPLTGSEIGGVAVLGLLGKGGMSEVYYAEADDVTYALKILPEERTTSAEYRARFEREARTLIELEHPNIVKVYAAGEHEGVPYMVMELVEGQQLSDLMRRRRLLLDDIRPLLADLASALDYAHSFDLVHRDLKPDNIMISMAQDGGGQRCVLMDFGIAKFLSGDITSYTGNKSIGTLNYIAPEQIRSSKSVDHRADIYAFGVMLFEMLAGRHPFLALTDAQMMMAHMEEEPPNLRDAIAGVSRETGDAIQRAMAKDPGERFGSAGEFVATLQ